MGKATDKHLQKMSAQISIIIPIYNAGKYLRRCLDSLKMQSLTQWEAILVNDGSTDNSGEICDEYARTDCRITVVHQENAGVSSARNRGIEMAKSKWLTFIDADDYVDINYLENLCKKIEDEKALIIQGLKQVNNSGEEVKRIEFEYSLLNGTTIHTAYNDKEIYEYGYTVAKLYNRDIINKHRIKFNEQISYSEDMLFMLEYILHCNSIKFIEGANYNYITESSNLSQRYNSHESEYLLFIEYTRLSIAIAEKWRFTPSYRAKRYGALILMRSIYSMYIAENWNDRIRIARLKQLKKEHHAYIKHYYSPNILLFRFLKFVFLSSIYLFNFCCKKKFRVKK